MHRRLASLEITVLLFFYKHTLLRLMSALIKLIITQVYGIMAQNERSPISLPAIIGKICICKFLIVMEHNMVGKILDMNTDTTTTLYQSS